eukprot:1811299-Rhodomonas_salina.1
MWKELETTGLPHPFYIVADTEYTGFTGIVCPYAGTNLTTYEDSLNFHVSQVRIDIECAFWMLYQLWGILWRGLRCRLGEVTKVIEACMLLHNYCIDFGDKQALCQQVGNVAVDEVQ